MVILLNPLTYVYVLIGQSGIGIDTPMFLGRPSPFHALVPSALVLLLVAIVGVWSSSRVAAYAGVRDPQYVVIDEVSGQHITLLLPLLFIAAPNQVLHGAESGGHSLSAMLTLLSWKYLLLGLILFRVFDIWKPFPVRQLEKLPGGWGIMADDWMAGAYAAICLRLALQLGLV